MMIRLLSVALELLPLIIVGMASPALISVSILLLSTQQPLRTASAFLLGAAAILLTLGTLVLLYFGGTLPFRAPQVGQTLSIMLGVLFLLIGIRSYLNMPDPDAPPAQWLAHIDRMAPRQAFFWGLLLVGTNLKIVAAYAFGVNSIIQARVSLLVGMLLLALLLVIILSGMLIPIGIYCIRPDDAQRILARFRAGIAHASRLLFTAAFLAIGLYFATRGLFGW